MEIFDELLADRAIWHPYTPSPHRGPRAVFKRAEGAFVYDTSGRRYFDATSSWWCITHGHCHPRLVNALSRQAGELDQILFSPHSHPVAMELATRLLERLGAPFEKIFFSDDGSTAVEAALKMAVQFWHNQGIRNRGLFVSLEGAYHGDTLGAVSVSQISQYHHYFDCLKMPTLKIPVPTSREEHIDECLHLAERAISPRAGEIAGLIVEPLVQGAAGMAFYPKRFLEGIVSLCRKNEILVIFDEVLTGFGRTGSFFAMDQLSVRPDIACLSKGLTAGMMPGAVTAVTGRIFDAFIESEDGAEEKTFYHGHTFTANALGCAVALENLKIFDEESVLKKNEALIRVLDSQREPFQGLRHVQNSRALGMIWAVNLVRDKMSNAAFQPANGPGWRIAEALWEKGYWVRPLGSVLYTIPPYCTAKSQLQEFFEVLYSELQNEKHFEG